MMIKKVFVNKTIKKRVSQGKSSQPDISSYRGKVFSFKSKCSSRFCGTIACIRTELLMHLLTDNFLSQLQCFTAELFKAYKSTFLRVSLLERDCMEWEL
jgi:hypothetical protein